MANIITTSADLDMARKYRETGYCYFESNGDNTYTVFFDETIKEESHPFGYRFKDSDDLTGVKNAWIRPDGTIFYVFWHGHNAFAKFNHDCYAGKLENNGWCHWSYGKVANTWDRFTKAQRDSIAFLYMANGDDKAAAAYIH